MCCSDAAVVPCSTSCNANSLQQKRCIPLIYDCEACYLQFNKILGVISQLNGYVLIHLLRVLFFLAIRLLLYYIFNSK